MSITPAAFAAMVRERDRYRRALEDIDNELQLFADDCPGIAEAVEQVAEYVQQALQIGYHAPVAVADRMDPGHVA